MARFKIDENLPDSVADLLQGDGHDAVTVGDRGLRGQDDEMLGRICRAERRAIVTLDRGFGDLRRHPPRRTAGIVVLRVESQDRQSILALVGRLLPALRQHSLENALWIVEESGIRIRGG